MRNGLDGGIDRYVTRVPVVEQWHANDRTSPPSAALTAQTLGRLSIRRLSNNLQGTIVHPLHRLRRLPKLWGG